MCVCVYVYSLSVSVSLSVFFSVASPITPKHTQSFHFCKVVEMRTVISSSK